MYQPLDQTFIDENLAKILVGQCSWYLLKNSGIFAEFFAIFRLSNWQNSELSRVLNTRPWQFNSNSCILWWIFVPKLHLRSLLRNLWFCTIFSAYLPFCWVSQQFYEKKIDYLNLYTKRQLFFFMQKFCKHTLQVINRGFKLL